jgi:putative drug exporter of the RND superfamily
MVERAFAKFGKFLIKARYFVLLFWIVLAIVMHFTAPSMSEVGTTDESSFLPAGSESTELRHLLNEKFPSQENVKGSSAILFYRPGGLSEQDME